MLCFPQLKSGASAQFPLIRRTIKRTVLTRMADGTAVKLEDPGWSTVEWQLDLRGLTTEEWDAIQSLFDGCEGRRGTFTFVDPTRNLIAHSENLADSVWDRSPAIETTPGLADPAGSQRATRLINAGQTVAGIEQALNAPAWFQYCSSVYARGNTGTEFWLVRRTTWGTARKACQIGPEWRRFEFPFKAAEESETVSFGMEVEGGASLDLFGFQVDSQAGASVYNRTANRNGIHAEARFEEDELSLLTEAPGVHSCLIRITARVE